MESKNPLFRRPKAPAVVYFEGLGDCYWELVGFRPPKRGEFYLSGAIVQGWRALSDYQEPNAYWVVVPTHHASVHTIIKPGKRVKVPPISDSRSRE